MVVVYDSIVVVVGMRKWYSSILYLGQVGKARVIVWRKARICHRGGGDRDWTGRDGTRVCVLSSCRTRVVAIRRSESYMKQAENTEYCAMAAMRRQGDTGGQGYMCNLCCISEWMVRLALTVAQGKYHGGSSCDRAPKARCLEEIGWPDCRVHPRHASNRQ